MSTDQLQQANELAEKKKVGEALLKNVKAAKTAGNITEINLFTSSGYCVAKLNIQPAPCLKPALDTFFILAEAALTEALSELDAEFNAL